ncbi:MAG: hypothetical protein C0407_01250 [Desulfobacca sp.]|nr:hypothetical protein [Desulfobacca sp.]
MKNPPSIPLWKRGIDEGFKVQFSIKKRNELKGYFSTLRGQKSSGLLEFLVETNSDNSAHQ